MSSKLLSPEELMSEISSIVSNFHPVSGTTVAHILLQRYLIIDAPKIDYKTDEHYDITNEGVTYDDRLVHPDDHRHVVSRLCEAADDYRGMQAVEEAYKEFGSISNKLKELAVKLYIKANSGLFYTAEGTNPSFEFSDIPRAQKDTYLEMAKLAFDFTEALAPKSAPAPSTPDFNKTAPVGPFQGMS